MADGDASRGTRRLSDVLLFLIFAVATGGLVYQATLDVNLYWSTRDWVRTNATMTFVHLTRDDRITSTDPPVTVVTFQCSVRYNYTVAHRTYTGNRSTILFRYGGRALCDGLSVHDTTPCYYAPTRPADSVLSLRFASWRTTLCLVCGFFASCYGLYGIERGFWDVDVAVQQRGLPPHCVVFAGLFAALSSVALITISVHGLSPDNLSFYASLVVGVLFAVAALGAPLHLFYNYCCSSERNKPNYGVVREPSDSVEMAASDTPV